MAGAGYKLFNTGDVLTAAQVNTYLMEQTVMVFANAAARTTALSGVVSEGMISYLKDTNAVEVYDGSNWVSSDDPNAIQNSIINAKGDLIVGSANDTPSILSVSSDGSTLVADSSASTGLRWQGSQAAGKNIVINGGFDIWQRGTSFTDNTSYSADRWAPHRSGFATGCSVSRQTITPSDVGGSARYAMQFGRASGNTSTAAIFNVQPIESAIFTQYAGQTVTLSLWVRAGANYSGGSTIGLTLFSGTADFTVGGGGGTTTAFAGTSPTITTSWTRVTLTGTVPSTAVGGLVQIAYTPSGTAGANDWVQITGVQYELGNVATTFTRAGGTLAGELAACQRYYQVVGGTSSGFPIFQGINTSASTQDLSVPISFVTTMRTSPTGLKNGTWLVANCSQPFLGFISADGFALRVNANATSSWYTHPDSTDDTFTFAAEL